jgi:hypothetical protein
VAFIDPIQPVPRDIVKEESSNFIEQRQWFELLRNKVNLIPKGSPGTVISHSALDDLTNDDHLQYHNDSRALTWLRTRTTTDLDEGSNLYYTNARVIALVDKAFVDALGVDHATLDNIGTNAHSAIDAHIADLSLHFTKASIETTTRITASQTLTTEYRNWFVNTDGGAVALALPAGAPTNYFRIVNCGSSGNKITITPDGTEKLKGVNAGKTLSDGSVVILAFETTEGWW